MRSRPRSLFPLAKGARRGMLIPTAAPSHSRSPSPGDFPAPLLNRLASNPSATALPNSRAGVSRLPSRRTHQPELDQRLEILQLQHLQPIAVAATRQGRRRHQAETPARGDQAQLQLAAESLEVQLQAQALIGQARCAGTEAAAIGVEHPAMVVAIEQASRLDGTVAGDHHAEFHAP